MRDSVAVGAERERLGFYALAGPRRVRLVSSRVDRVVLPEPVRLKKTVGRMATYLQAYGVILHGAAPKDLEPIINAYG